LYNKNKNVGQNIKRIKNPGLENQQIGEKIKLKIYEKWSVLKKSIIIIKLIEYIIVK